MGARDIVDSHIHLWPASAANEYGHRWMIKGFILSKQHVLSNYVSVSSSYPPSAVVYIETDRRLEDPSTSSLTTWAAQPIEELLFLRSIVEGEYGARDAEVLKGIIPWAPVHRGKALFEQWLALAQKTMGAKTWGRVKGFRFLLQAITDRTEFEKLVLSEDFIAILKSFNQPGRQFSFDVGVDQRSGGTWQLEVFAQVLERVYRDVPEEQRTVFIMSPFSHPYLQEPPTDSARPHVQTRLHNHRPNRPSKSRLPTLETLHPNLRILSKRLHETIRWLLRALGRWSCRHFFAS